MGGDVDSHSSACWNVAEVTRHHATSLHLAVRDAALGASLAHLAAAVDKEWWLLGVANLSWGQRLPMRVEQMEQVLKGLWATCTEEGLPSLCRICCLLGP